MSSSSTQGSPLTRLLPPRSPTLRATGLARRDAPAAAAAAAAAVAACCCFLETGAWETCARVTMLMALAPENTGWEETESRCNWRGPAVAVFRRHYHRDNGDST